MNGNNCFIVLMEDGKPSVAMPSRDWIKIPHDERPDNAYLVYARDELDAFVRAQRGEIP